MVIYEADIARCLRSCFAFAERFFRLIDPYLRHTSFWFGTSLVNAGFRAIVKDAPTNGTPIRMRSHEQDPILAEDPRRVSRDVLASPDAGIERVIAYLRRRLRE